MPAIFERPPDATYPRARKCDAPSEFDMRCKRQQQVYVYYLQGHELALQAVAKFTTR